MDFTLAKNIHDNYKYLITIKCIVSKDWNFRYIPSFTTNTLTNYLTKSKEDINDIIKEIFLVWRYKYHSDDKTKKLNMEYMEQIIQHVDNLKFFSYLEYTINSGFDSSIFCYIKIYPMRYEFIHLLDLIDIQNSNFKHSIYPYIVFKDSNPNRLELYIVNPKNIAIEQKQTFVKLNKIYNMEFYQSIFEKLGLSLTKPEKFMKQLNSNNSFILTKDDFSSNKEILYSNIYFMTHIDERVTTIQNELYFLKTDKLLSKKSYTKITSFL